MTRNSLSYNRTLFLEDNLPVLRGLDSKSIDLIATDPPFNKGVGAFEGTTKAGVNIEFKDVWHWDDVQDEWLDEIKDEHSRLFNMVHYANESAGNDMGAFICWLGVRVLEMQRVLKPTGSIYLHCDPTASHYIKAMMDAIFGRKNFRNEIVWKRHSGRAGGKQFGRVHDIILFYSNGSDYTWNMQRLPHDEGYIKRAYRHQDARGRFRVGDLTAPGVSDGESGRPWRGVDPSARGRHWFTPTKGGMNDFIIENDLIRGWPDEYHGVHARLDTLDEAGLIFWPAKQDGMPGLKRYLKSAKGPEAEDVITDIKRLEANSKERTGYPTQKPLALYKRMVASSSNPGDMVLDPFAGCATTCVAAEQLGRQWIGIDIREESGDVIRERLENEVNGSMAWDAVVRTPTEAPERTDDGEPAAPDLVLEAPKQEEKEKRISVREAREQLAVRDGMRCRGCGWAPPRLEYLHVDHRKPKKEGGPGSMQNFVLLCEPCNRLKSYKMSLAELRERRREQGEGYIDMEWYEKEGRWE